MRIADAADRPVPEGTIGGLQVSGPFVTTGYLENPAANLEAFTADGWFKTGDLGRIRNGRLTITGREKDVIIINGVNYYSHDIEKVVEDTPGVEVSFAAAFAVRAPGTDTDRLAICFSPLQWSPTTLRWRRCSVKSGSAWPRFGVHPTYLVPVQRGEIPKTHRQDPARGVAHRLKAGDFDGCLRRVDVLLENAQTIPDWFAQPRLAPAAHPTSARRRRGVLVFVDDGGVGSRVVAELSATGTDCVRVTRGPAFARVGRHAYVVPPG